MAERFGWPPQVVLELTPLQAAILLGMRTDRRTVWMSPQEYRVWLAARGTNDG